MNMPISADNSLSTDGVALPPSTVGALNNADFDVSAGSAEVSSQIPQDGYSATSDDQRNYTQLCKENGFCASGMWGDQYSNKLTAGNNIVQAQGSVSIYRACFVN
jgi:hypothetical protein